MSANAWFIDAHYVALAEYLDARRPALVACLCCSATFSLSAPLPTRDEVLRLLRHSMAHVAPAGAVTAARMTGVPRAIGRA